MVIDTVLWSKWLTGLTLAFHVIFATVGVGVPLMIAIAEFVGIRKKDPHYTLMAKRWTRGFVISVAVGVVTGTAISLLLALVWPNFMQVAGNVIALPLFMEVFAFFFEAIFLGIYMYTWDRFRNPYIHWLLTIPIVAGAGMSAVFITTVNGFMNQPGGFVMEAGHFTAVNPLQAMLNTATPSKVFHVLTSAYLTGAALLAGIAAYVILRKGATAYYKKALKLMMAVVLVFSLLTTLAGDMSAKFLAEHQPEKLAAAEWHFETESGADLILLGWLNAEREVMGAIHIPKALSFLAFGDFDAEVKGLEEFPLDERPPLLVHYLFDFMAGIGFVMLAVAVLYFLFLFWKRRNELNKWLLRAIVFSAPLAFLGVEMGWFYAELGRQPWIIRGYMRVEEAATTSPNVRILFFLFLLLYIVLGTMCVFVLRRLFRNKPAEAELDEFVKEKRDQSTGKGEPV
ncbi:cytochrome ubiquinol oxidase subunit I [Virgibacillus sp. LDC1]|uniref:cytochrome ubiquinol oxidase subunit I n=1 Tax=Paenibacillus TaxID=44249 RepID=UPI000C275B62|nr:MULTISPECIES: cytochrome ubiquinol oxidase subunit I [Paenibacillus]MCV4234207.1 cytochrome ubiquinol oxidase subunit I [Virgibacillus sp. LDC1]MEC0254812.1 cytochrome ubiquinol oxidase subunit I [Paenibacillus lautus]MEC0309108.1 cytochrome ubiquinol oxidase subunit I [Paenibacillus lautus]PJN51819.1 putative cytochrome bd menaquinol oxidase subunit I [Paenibacillus sp. GM2FR]